MLRLAYLIPAVHANDVLHNNFRQSEFIMAFIFDTLTYLIK